MSEAIQSAEWRNLVFSRGERKAGSSTPQIDPKHRIGLLRSK